MPDPVTAVQAAATVGSAAIGSSAARKASQAQQDAAAQSLALQQRMYDEQVARAQPFLQTGGAGVNRMAELLGIGGDTGAAGYGTLGGPFTMETFKADPFYQYSLGQGIKDLERTAAARGGLLSGATIRGYKDVQGKEYENAFNRYYTGRANTLAPYMSLGQLGTNTLGTLGGASQQLASGGTGAYGAMGAARASGYNQQADILNQLLNVGAQAYGQSRGPGSMTLDQLLPEVTVTGRKVPTSFAPTTPSPYMRTPGPGVMY